MELIGKRDPGIQGIVDHFDQFQLKNPTLSRDELFEKMKPQERQAIFEQVKACADDFTYVARNYFCFTNKSGQDCLFRLWESQWLILQKYYELKRKGKAQKLIVLKARQLGASLLIEAMIAWRTMFYPNTEAIVVSVDAEHSGYLFGLMLHFYEQMPFWLKPEACALEYKDGLQFDRKDREQRRISPGLNSKISVQHASQMSGVGQGRRISAAHASEFTDWYQSKAKEIIEGDLLHAISDTPNSFAFLESTGRGAGSYSHMLWRACEKLGEDSDWHTLFLPWFFESTRVLAPPQGWTPKREEAMLKKRVGGEWVRCKYCRQYQTAAVFGASLHGTLCPACGQGKLLDLILTDEQLFWKEIRRRNAEAKDKESLKKHKSEMSSTAEEAWQLSGMSVFDELCQERVNETILDPNKVAGVKRGFVDINRQFHGVNGERGCYIDGCKQDHRFDANDFIVWEDPIQGRDYCIGVDIAEGIGEDYSVIFVNKVGRAGEPDEQVGVFSSNTIEPHELAFLCDAIGRMFNEALLCIEYNFARIVGDLVAWTYLYPNIFQWKHPDHRRPVSTTMHWITQGWTKPKLWQTARSWIKSGGWIIRDPEFLTEMQTFQKDEEESKTASHVKGAHDDILMAGMIALYCAHEIEADESGRVPTPMMRQELAEPTRYQMICQGCGHGKKIEDGKPEWGSGNPEDEYRCPECGGVRLIGKLLHDLEDRRSKVDQIAWEGDYIALNPKGLVHDPDLVSAELPTKGPEDPYGLGERPRRWDPSDISIDLL